MNKHFRYILFFILIIATIVISASIVLTNQFFKFYNSYIEEEIEELDHQILLVEWAVKPILKEKNSQKLKLFAKELKDVDIAIFITDENNTPIVQSRNDIDVKQIKFNNFDSNKRTIKNYKHTLKEKMIAKEKAIYVDNSKYLIKIALLQDNMIATFLKNQQNIIFVYLIGIIIIISFSIHFIFYLKIPFDKLQKSAIKIASGDYKNEIFIIKKGMLAQHSKTIADMAKQLKEKIEELKNIEIEKNEMLCNFSHEAKTPLTSILLSCELLKPEIKNEQMLDCINILESNAQRLNDLILNIIDISKLEYINLNRQKNFSNILLEDCINSAIENCKTIAGNIKINLTIKNSINLSADSELLQTAIINILTNAIKYSKTKNIDITTIKEENFALIKIRDYGIGIEKQHLTKIFDKFYRPDKTRSRELGGSGLGLAIVKKIINIHGGEIIVNSNDDKINQGCEFTIKLLIKIDTKLEAQS